MEHNLKYRWFIQANRKLDHVSALIVGVLGSDTDQAERLIEEYNCYPVAIWKIKKIALL